MRLTFVALACVAATVTLAACTNDPGPTRAPDAAMPRADAGVPVDAGQLPDSGVPPPPDASTGVGCMRASAFACDATTPAAHVCIEYAMGDVSTYGHSCMVRGGRFVTYCPRTDAFGACEIEGGVLGCQRRVFYVAPDAGTPDAATIAAAMATCAASDPTATWVMY